MHIEVDNFLTVYPELVQLVQGGGITASPRGQEVTEYPLPLAWTIQNPQKWALTIPGRKMNPFFALAEVVWMWSGKSGAEFITYYNKSFAQFLDGNIPYFNAAYGARVRHYGYREVPFRDTPHPYTTGQVHEPVEVDQLFHVISKLQRDPSTRQAVVALWDPIKDNFHQSKDYPCNNMVYFSNRDGKLNVTVVIRSNDLIWGTPHNMIQFAHLQALIAGSLGLGMGWFTVLCNNLHYYTNLYKPTLETVQKWAAPANTSRIDLMKVSRELNTPGWDMRWSLDAFDLFVREFWEPLEKDIRFFANTSDQTAADPYFHIRYMRLEDFANRYGVPEYWLHLFTVMLMYHARKAGAMQTFAMMLELIPNPMKWLVLDFVTKGQDIATVD